MRRKSRRQLRQSRFYKLITYLNPKSPISEAYRTLRTNIQFASVDSEVRTLMFTSAGPSEGKTTTVANLAIVSAQAGKKVVIVDADLRKPTVHHTFRVPNSLGLANILVGQAPLQRVVQRSEIENLDVITAGPIPPNPAEMLASKAMKQLLEELKADYDLVILDTPPVIAVTDAQVLASQVDGVILVIHAGKTDRELAIKAKQQLENVKAHLLGVVLNQKRIDANSYYYYYYYGESRT